MASAKRRRTRGARVSQVLGLHDDVQALGIAAEGREVEVACRGHSVNRRVVPKFETGSLDDGHIGPEGFFRDVGHLEESAGDDRDVRGLGNGRVAFFLSPPGHDFASKAKVGRRCSMA